MTTGTSAPGQRILVVDDEAPLARLVADYLVRAGYEVSVVGNGAAAVRTARKQDPDVVVLDLSLPELDGVEVCRQLRTFSDCYVLMLTARSEETDKLIGLSVGADDYMTKPFSPRELVARVHVLLRRPRASGTDKNKISMVDAREALVLGPLRIVPASREVLLSGEPVTLTPTEFDLLATLAANPQRAFSRTDLIKNVWGENWFGDDRLVDVHIGHLRRKLRDDPASPTFIRTVRGVGYRMGTGE